MGKSCYQSQNYKIWKQFTTLTEPTLFHLTLLSIAKLQNLKAIHNSFKRHTLIIAVVINRKTTKFESNSQLRTNDELAIVGCYQSQNYKIWKQFTTIQRDKPSGVMLLSIAKLQNLKAIHNRIRLLQARSPVVINRKTTKFESNSQLIESVSVKVRCCYQSQNYKIWKQFTTSY